MHQQSVLPTILWLLCWTAASVVYRKLAGKPIWLRAVQDAVFLERAASGHGNDNLLQKIGGARNCLVVAVAANRFIVRPFFPFNLFFLPEVYGLEHDVEIERIVRTKLGKFLWMKSLDVTFVDERQRFTRVTLYLKKPEELDAILTSARTKSAA